MTTVLDAALALSAAGCSVIPASADGTKAPLGAWRHWTTARPGDDQLHAWLDTGHPGIGVVTGAVSGNLEMLELEGRAVTAGMLADITGLATAAGLGGLWQQLLAGYLETTPGGGIHILYRLDGGPVPGNTKLGARPARDDELTAAERDRLTAAAAAGRTAAITRTLAETRGEGGFVIVAPSHGATHPTGRPWQLGAGAAATIPVISRADRDALHDLIRSLGAEPQPAGPAFAQPAHEHGGGQLAPGEDYAARTDWAAILKPAGWRLVAARGPVRYWRRPGKDRGISATTGRPPHDNLYVFSTSTDFPSEEPVSKFAAWALIHGHGTDLSGAARALRTAGYGTQPAAAAVPVPPPAHPPAPEPAPGAGTAAADPGEHTSWHPVDLGAVLAGDASGDPEPVVLARDDGRHLLYAGKVNGLIGESESGKTWVALHAVSQVLAAGAHVAYWDFEDSAAGITGRLLAMGTPAEQIARRFHYASPDEPLTPAAAADVAVVLADYAPALAVIDGVNSAMTLLGLNLKDNMDATAFSQRVLRPLKRSGAAVLTIDHVTKDRESRGNGAIGAQAKRADIDGVSITVDAVRKFGRGQEGRLRLSVSKDRPGHVRAISSGADYAGMVTIKPRDGGAISISISAPDMRPYEERGPWRPTGIMERVSKLIEEKPGITSRAIRQAITGKAAHTDAALARLIEERYVTTETGSRGAVMHTSASPYREASDTYETTVSHRVPTVSRGPGTRSSAGPDDRVPETMREPTALMGRDTVGSTGAGDTLATATVSPGAACRGCGEKLPHSGRPCQDPGAVA